MTKTNPNTRQYLVKTDFGKIEYTSQGQGFTVLILHGGHSNCQDKLVATGFDYDKFKVIIPTRPGYGETNLKGNESPENAARIMAYLLKELNTSEAIVIGVSAGGPTAIALTAKHPELVKGLILASAVTKKWLTTKQVIYWVSRMLFAPAIEKSTWSLMKLMFKTLPGLMSKIMMIQLSKAKNHTVKQKDREELIRFMANSSSGKGFINDLHQNPNTDLLLKINIHTLIIHSSNDKAVNKDHALFAANKITNNTIELLDNDWGHLIWIGNSAALVWEKTNNYLHKVAGSSNHHPKEVS